MKVPGGDPLDSTAELRQQPMGGKEWGPNTLREGTKTKRVCSQIVVSEGDGNSRMGQ